MQRRHYFETRDALPAEFREQVDKIYDEIPHMFDELKRELNSMGHKEERLRMLIEKIRDIGEGIQKTRPDHARLQGARIMTAEGGPATSELDARCKWLMGTLHLMVRKMHDNKEPMDLIKEKVEANIREVAQLKECLHHVSYSTSSRDPYPSGTSDGAPPARPPAVSGRAAEQERLIAQLPDWDWLQEAMRSRLAAASRSGALTEQNAMQLLRSIVAECEKLDSAERFLGEEYIKTTLTRGNSLPEFNASLQEVMNKLKDRLLDAESLEDYGAECLADEE